MPKIVNGVIVNDEADNLRRTRDIEAQQPVSLAAGDHDTCDCCRSASNNSCFKLLCYRVPMCFVSIPLILIPLIFTGLWLAVSVESALLFVALSSLVIICSLDCSRSSTSGGLGNTYTSSGVSSGGGGQARVRTIRDLPPAPQAASGG